MPRFSYDGRARRWPRKTLDLLWSGAQARGGETAVVRCHWWEHAKNFGDLLTPLILPKFGIHPVTAPAQDADLVGIGSLLQHLDAGSTATVWGTGLIRDETTPLPDVRTPALRGRLTAERISARGVTAFGDPGLLLELLLRRAHVAKGRHRLGVVPHYAHLEDPEYRRLIAQARGDDSVTVVDVRRHPVRVAAHIASCDVVATSSLHGLITADSLGIPAVSLRGSTDLVGGDFKFLDHETVALPGRERRVSMAELDSLDEAADRAVAADPRAVEAAKAGLVRTGNDLTRITAHRLVRGIDLPRAALRAARTEDR